MIDRNPRVNPTIVHDLSKFPWPLEANSFDFIHCSQVIEHLPDIVDAMSEILRVAAPGCRVVIGVPHFSSAIAYRDPTHRTFFFRQNDDLFRRTGHTLFGPAAGKMLGDCFPTDYVFEVLAADRPGRVIQQIPTTLRREAARYLSGQIHHVGVAR